MRTGSASLIVLRKMLQPLVLTRHAKLKSTSEDSPSMRLPMISKQSSLHMSRRDFPSHDARRINSAVARKTARFSYKGTSKHVLRSDTWAKAKTITLKEMARNLILLHKESRVFQLLKIEDVGPGGSGISCRGTPVKIMT
jgi:hypothetical protein